MREIILNLDTTKERVKKLQGRQIILKVNKGRNRYISFHGKIESLYPSVFTVRDSEGNALSTYSYSDVLTKTVLFCKDEKEKSL